MARKKDERNRQSGKSNGSGKGKGRSGQKRERGYLQDNKEHYASFSDQMSAMALMLRDIPGDGNCLFRALADQLEGHGRNHLQLRSDTVQYMLDHREDFEPFTEDDISFDKHAENLRKPGTYGGQECIVAFARLHHVNIIIHQLNSPLWQIDGVDEGASPSAELHLSYHNGEHYSSVRKEGDFEQSPANIHLVPQEGQKTNVPFADQRPSTSHSPPPQGAAAKVTSKRSSQSGSKKRPTPPASPTEDTNSGSSTLNSASSLSASDPKKHCAQVHTPPVARQMSAPVGSMQAPRAEPDSDLEDDATAQETTGPPNGEVDPSLDSGFGSAALLEPPVRPNGGRSPTLSRPLSENGLLTIVPDFNPLQNGPDFGPLQDPDFSLDNGQDFEPLNEVDIQTVMLQSGCDFGTAQVTLEACGGSVEVAVDTLINLMLTANTGDRTSCAKKFPDRSEGGATPKPKGVPLIEPPLKVAIADRTSCAKKFPDRSEGGATPKPKRVPPGEPPKRLTNRQRKDQKRQEKLQRQRDRKSEPPPEEDTVSNLIIQCQRLNL